MKKENEKRKREKQKKKDRTLVSGSISLNNQTYTILKDVLIIHKENLELKG